jgi:hypothetical protein
MAYTKKEAATGRGKVFLQEQLICETSYGVWIEEGVVDEPVLGGTQPILETQRLRGSIWPSPADLSVCLHASTPLTLHLSDGRRLDFRVVDNLGHIADASGRGIYKEIQ